MRRAAPLLSLLVACGGSFEGGGTDAGLTDGGPDPDGGVVEAATLYDPEAFPTFELVISESSWEALDREPRVYQPATFRYGDVELLVGLRLKGWASMRRLDEKAAFKIKFDEYVDGQRFLGLRRLTLNNMVQDPSMVAERLGYWFFRESGVVASRCNSARVFVNGDYYGLFANLETLDDEFVEARFEPAPGNLYDILDYFVDLFPGSEGGYELETNQDFPDTSDLTALIEAVNGPAETFVADAETLLDLDAVLAMGAAQAIVGDWDGYFGARNNYELYHELARDRFIMFPWGIDQTFLDVDYDVYGSDSNRRNGWLFIRCKSDLGCLARYEEAVAHALSVWESLPLESELDAIYAQIRDAAYEDVRKPFSNERFEDEVRRVRRFVQERAVRVQAQLDGPLPELCENGIDDDGNGRTDCDDPECAGVCG